MPNAMSGFDFTIAWFGLVSRLDVHPDGMMGFLFQHEITRDTRGLSASQVMEPFVHTDLTLAVGIEEIRRTARHSVAYHVEEPDGEVSMLTQAKPSDWPAWTLEDAPEESARLAIAHERYGNVESRIQPSFETFVGGQRWAALRPLALRFRLPGLHTYRLLIDSRVAGEFELIVVYDSRPEIDAPV